MLSKVIFPNPFGFTKPTKEEIQSLQKKYNFSEEYATFLVEQNGFNDFIFFDSNYTHFTATYEGKEPWQFFGGLYGLNSPSEYYDLIEAQTYNIFESILFKIGTDPAGNEFVEVLRGNKKGWIGCIDHDYYISHDTLNSFIEEVETNFKSLNQLSLEELTEILISDDFGMMNFHAKSMNQFLADCFIIKDQSILIKDLEVE